jgi:beta-lactam-binding protein with PASTA domain
LVAVLAMSLVLIAPLEAGASTGHAPRHMPRLVGLTRAQVYAVMKADQLYFQTRGPGSANGTCVAVAAQSPAPGTLVAWHAEATLTTTMRAAHARRAVPRVIGLSRAQTFAAMRRAGLYFQTSGPGSSTGRWVVVVHQSPRPGTRVAWHAEVLLSVSTHRPRPVVKTVTTVKRTTTTLRHPTTTTTRPIVKVTTTTTSTTVAVSTTTYPGEVTTTTTTPTTTTTVRVTTTTVRATTTTVRKRPVRYRIGVATWYSYFPGRCATWYLPMGTRITVRDLDNGRSIHCVVTDREGAHGNRVVDLNEAQFSQLAPLHVGVIRVKVSW